MLLSALLLSVLAVVFWIRMPHFHLDRTVSFLLEMYFSVSILSLNYVLPASVLPYCDALPLFEDVEVCAAHVQAFACRIQGGTGPWGCDAAHLRDVLLHYGPHGGCLRDSFAAVACELCNSITPWMMCKF